MPGGDSINYDYACLQEGVDDILSATVDVSTTISELENQVRGVVQVWTGASADDYRLQAHKITTELNEMDVTLRNVGHGVQTSAEETQRLDRNLASMFH